MLYRTNVMLRDVCSCLLATTVVAVPWHFAPACGERGAAGGMRRREKSRLISCVALGICSRAGWETQGRSRGMSVLEAITRTRVRAVMAKEGSCAQGKRG